jgi:N-dimethylarginine dimethylaminohydrolase
MVVESSSKAAVVEVNNSSREALPYAVYTVDTMLMFGFAVVVILIALYFVLRQFT